jgi:hypothetical protein
MVHQRCIRRLSGLYHVSTSSEFFKNKEYLKKTNKRLILQINHAIDCSIDLLLLINIYIWLLYFLFSERCSLTPTGPIDGINSYTYMNILNMSLCLFITLSVITANSDYHELALDYLDNSYRWFYMLRNIFIYYTVSCICNQLVSAFSCRSIHILYDLRFMSVVIVQIGGFFVCLLLAFLLGIKYALLDHSW